MVDRDGFDRDAFDRDLAAIQSTLLREWDPIGVAEVPEARSEYDAYLPRVYALLARGAPAEEVAAYLAGLDFGLPPVPGERLSRTAEALCALGVRPPRPGLSGQADR
jgi:hypothetical protein